MASMHIYTVGQRCAQLLRFSSYNPHHGLYPSSSFLAYIHSWPKVCPAPQLFTFTEGHAPIIAGRPSITRNVGLPYATSLGGLAGLRYPRHLAGHTAQSSPEGSNSSLTFSQHHPVVRRVTGRSTRIVIHSWACLRAVSRCGLRRFILRPVRGVWTMLDAAVNVVGTKETSTSTVSRS